MQRGRYDRLTNREYEVMRRLHATGMSQAAIARAYGCDPSHVWKITHRDDGGAYVGPIWRASTEEPTPQRSPQATP